MPRSRLLGQRFAGLKSFCSIACKARRSDSKSELFECSASIDGRWSHSWISKPVRCWRESI